MDAGNQGLLGMCRDTLQGVLAGWSDQHLSIQVRHRARLRGHSRGRDTVSLSAVRAANKGKWKDIRRRLVGGSRGKWGVNAAPPRDALRADSKGAPLQPRPRAGKEPASHAPERAEKVLAEETVSAKAWWAEFEDQDGGRGLGLSRRDMGQQGAEERRQSRPRRALLASAQRPAVGGPCGATDGHETGG